MYWLSVSHRITITREQEKGTGMNECISPMRFIYMKEPITVTTPLSEIHPQELVLTDNLDRGVLEPDWGRQVIATEQIPKRRYNRQPVSARLVRGRWRNASKAHEHR